MEAKLIVRCACRAVRDAPVDATGRRRVKHSMFPVWSIEWPVHENTMMAEQEKRAGKTIAVNKRARFEFYIEERFEAGIALEGWEVKSLRAGHVQFADSYVLLKDNEAFLFGCHMDPLPTVSDHVKADPTRTRKLLLHRREIDHLVGMVERKGFTLIPTAMYFSRGRVKVEVGLAKGKRQHDKRKVIKDRDWQRQKERIMKHSR